MESSNIHPEPQTLAKLSPMDGLNETQLALLAQMLNIRSATTGEVILQLGDATDATFYLLHGRLLLRSGDARHLEITAGTPQAMRPIASLSPRRYEVTALSQVDYLLVDNHLLQGLFSEQTGGITATEIFTQEQPQSRSETENQLAQALTEDLENGCLSLPSLPDIAIRVGQAMRDENSNAQKLAHIIQTDPAITTKLIHAANSPLYVGTSKVNSCKEAVVRLGSSITHKLVLTFALRELFNAQSNILKHRMQELLEHSVKVSAVCYVLAKLSDQFDPEQALLAGLLHDIGVVAILSYAERFPELAKSAAEIDSVIQDLRAPIGAQILSTWDFMEDLVTVAEEAENWRRQTDGPADYADLVIIAQLHCFIGSEKMRQLPSLDQVPAFTKLDLGELTPKLSLKILEKADEKISRAESLLRG